MNTHSTGNRMLLAASGLLLAAVLLHGVDHALIQERGVGALTTEVLIGGGVNAALAAVAVLTRTWDAPSRTRT